jgi:hypothetical protein
MFNNKELIINFKVKYKIKKYNLKSDKFLKLNL